MWSTRKEEWLEIVNLGDQLKCPQCSRIARVIWISHDGKQAGIRCSGHHNQMSRGVSKFGSVARPQSKTQKNMVFLVDTELMTIFAPTQR
jgi:glutamine synthetase type III